MEKQFDLKRRIARAFIAVAVILAALAPGFAGRVLASGTEADNPSGIRSCADLKGKKVGVVLGSKYGQYMEDVVHAKEVLYYNTKSDLLEAMRSGKVDAIILSGTMLEEARRETGDFVVVYDEVLREDVGFIFQKSDSGEKLCEEMDAYLQELKDSGEMEALREKWFGEDVSQRNAVDMSGLTGENDTITYVTDLSLVPYNYEDNGSYKGYEMEMLVGFCERMGYDLEFMNTDFSGFIASVVSGRADIGGTGVYITEERKEEVLFSIVTNQDGGAIAVYTGSNEGETFFESIKDSFYSTFVEENRWRMILDGLVVTLRITVLAAAFGTAFGFVLYFARSGKKKVAGGIAAALMRIVQGVPMLVILMVLYYIVFAAAGLSGEIVSVVGFAITFGCAVAAILLNCIGGVDKGQWEASAALGFEKGSTFRRVILPQALYQILPLYQGELIALLKSTSIVGYIAVADLTKASDIIRSRTFDAFFPILSTALLYFLISWGAASLLKLLQLQMDPEKHRRKALKGIRTTDSGKIDTAAIRPLGEPGEEIARFSHMEKRYPDGGVPLKDVNAVVRRGDVVTIIGPSGTGKSTFMRCLNRLELHTKGEVYAFGKPVPSDKKELSEMRRRMGMVFQSFNLFPHLTVIENVMFAQIHLKGKSRQEAYEYAERMLQLVGMGEKLLSYPDALSGGQKQRVAIARTLAMDPEIILFDEPTSALDPTMVGQVLSLIRELGERGFTLMIVTHEMKFAREVSTRIFYLDQGEVYEEGTPEEIFEHPRRSRTRAFVQRLNVFRTNITSFQYDYIETQEMLQSFGEKNRMSDRQITALRRCFEEITVNGILPELENPFEVKVFLEYSGEEKKAFLRFVYEGPERNPFEHMDELSLALIRASTLKLDYTYRDGANRAAAVF